MITGKTKNLGVIGYPIAHSLSPVIHNPALAKAKLDYVYTALKVAPESLATAVNGLRALNYRGFNVTIPHKAAIMPLLDEIDEDAKIIGAVNTVVNDNGLLKGYNTDAAGFINALKDTGFILENSEVVLLGAGGAARAIIWGLIKSKVKAIHIGVRNLAKVKDLVQEFSAYTAITADNFAADSFKAKLKNADLLVNTTPLGMTPKVDAMPPIDWQDVNPTAFCYDIIYTPAVTRFLREAKANGHKILNGEGMLAGQGAAAFTLWTGIEPDLELMKKSLRESLAAN